MNISHIFIEVSGLFEVKLRWIGVNPIILGTLNNGRNHTDRTNCRISMLVWNMVNKWTSLGSISVIRLFYVIHRNRKYVRRSRKYIWTTLRSTLWRKQLKLEKIHYLKIYFDSKLRRLISLIKCYVIYVFVLITTCQKKQPKNATWAFYFITGILFRSRSICSYLEQLTRCSVQFMLIFVRVLKGKIAKKIVKNILYKGFYRFRRIDMVSRYLNS